MFANALFPLLGDASSSVRVDLEKALQLIIGVDRGRDHIQTILERIGNKDTSKRVFLFASRFLK
jgi:hypothetical protein